MVIPPSTDIVLLNCPLTEDQNHQLTFNSVKAQQDYFVGLGGVEAENCTYQRQDQAIRYPAGIDSIRNYNYIRYQNENYSSKWFYAFITKMEYVNDNVTLIYLKTDVYQTWMFDFVIHESYVEREHVNDDTIGLHTYPELLETGPYTMNSGILPNFYDPQNCGIVVQISEWLYDNPAFTEAFNMQNRIPSGTFYIWFNLNTDTPEGQADISAFTRVLREYQNGKSEAILSIFPYPLSALNSRTAHVTTPVGDIKKITSSGDPDIFWNGTINRPGNLNGYTPKNNKLLTYPYCYFYYDNNNGSIQEYHFEDFTGNPGFRALGAITTGINGKMIPTNYKNQSGNLNYQYGVNLGNMPLGSWTNDIYANWLALNSTAQNYEMEQAQIRGLLNAGLAASTGNIGGFLESQISVQETVRNTMIQREQHAMLPNQAGGDVANSPLNYSSGNNDGVFGIMTIKSEYARIIDDYFSAYGYTVNALKIPNITGRENWNYVKTIEANLTGNMPQDDLEEIKTILDKGITFWHKPENFLNYNVNNSII